MAMVAKRKTYKWRQDVDDHIAGNGNEIEELQKEQW